MRNFLIRDDGAVFPYDEETAERKNMRLMRKAEAERYLECLENRTPFTPDSEEGDDGQILSEWGLDLFSGAVVPTAEAVDAPGVIVLTLEQEKIAREAGRFDIQEGELPQEGTAIDLNSMTVPSLRKYAKENFRIELPRTVSKAEAIAAINAGG